MGANRIWTVNWYYVCKEIFLIFSTVNSFARIADQCKYVTPSKCLISLEFLKNKVCYLIFLQILICRVSNFQLVQFFTKPSCKIRTTESGIEATFSLIWVLWWNTMTCSLIYGYMDLYMDKYHICMWQSQVWVQLDLHKVKRFIGWLLLPWQPSFGDRRKEDLQKTTLSQC